MKTKYIILAILLLLPSFTWAEKVFVFQMTEFGAIMKDGKGLPTHQSNKEIAIVIDDNGITVKGAIDHELMFESTSKWYFNELGALTNGGAGGNILSISLSKKSVSMGGGGTTMVFSRPGNPNQFVSTYNSLVAFLTQAGRFKTTSSNQSPQSGKNKNTTGKTQPKGQNTTTTKAKPTVPEKKPGIIEPDKELTITDMLYKPMGILTASPDIWSMLYPDVLSAAKQRDNWELHSSYKYESEFGVYGNMNFGQKRAKGYNMTYKGEPYFCMTVRAAHYGNAWGKGKVEAYQYSFHRNIKGKVPKISSYRKNEILKQPQWTQNEALDFAKAIVADLERVGIRMAKIKNLKGDIYTMEGIDNKTNSKIKVRVFKADNKSSAFFSVTLEVKSIANS